MAKITITKNPRVRDVQIEKENAIKRDLPIVNGKQVLNFTRFSLPSGTSETTYELEDGTSLKVNEKNEIIQ